MVNEQDPTAWLDEKHSHYEKMDTDQRWKRWRAILDGLDDEDSKKRFLPKTEVELEADYKFRLSIAEFLGVTDGAIERICSAVFGTPAIVESKSNIVANFIKNCDGNGTSIVDFYENVSPEAQTMGIAFVGIDRKKSNETYATLAHEQASGVLKCFATLYKAEDVRNWSFDSDGRPDVVVIGRQVSERPNIRSEEKHYDERRVLTKTTIEIWRKEIDENGRPVRDGEKWTMVGEPVAHNLGVVPLVPLYGKFISHLCGTSMHRGTMKADISRFSEETWAALSRYRHANQLLALKSARDIKEIVVGPVFRLINDEDLGYVSPSGTAFDAQETAIARLRREAVSQSGTNPAATSDAPNSTTGESGIAQRVRFTHTEQRAIEDHARSIASSMLQVLRIVETWLTGKQPVEEPTVTFFTKFEAQTLDDMTSAYQRSQYWIQSPTWHREMLKKIATQSLSDASDETKKQISQEIDKQAPPDPAIDPAVHAIGN